MIRITDMFEVEIMANQPLASAFMEWLIQEMKANRISSLSVSGGSGRGWVVRHFAPEYRKKIDRFFMDHEHLIHTLDPDRVSVAHPEGTPS